MGVSVKKVKQGLLLIVLTLASSDLSLSSPPKLQHLRNMSAMTSETNYLELSQTSQVKFPALHETAFNSDISHRTGGS